MKLNQIIIMKFEWLLLVEQKIDLIDLNVQLLYWTNVYFVGRQQLIKIDWNTISNPINVTSVVG